MNMYEGGELVSWSVEDIYHQWRIDAYLAEVAREDSQIQGLSRTRVQELIQQGRVQVNGQPVGKSNFKVNYSDKVEMQVPQPEPIEAEPEDLPLEIIYQDEALAVVNKPEDMVVHPAGGRIRGTLVNALLYHLTGLSGIGGRLRPGIVHRLDKGTSGLLIVAKTDEAHQQLTAQFKAREIKKTYLTIVDGRMRQPEGEINFPMARHRTKRHKMAAVMDPREGQDGQRRRKVKRALTRYRVIKNWEQNSLLAVFPETGRTHQIRVHLSQLGHPVVGDGTYGFELRKGYSIPGRFITELHGPALHAWKLDFSHPVTGEQMHFETPIPPRLQKIIEYLDQ